MKTKINCAWKQEMTFEADVNGFKIMMDTDPAVGITGRAPSRLHWFPLQDAPGWM
jgi:hypothetical protein